MWFFPSFTQQILFLRILFIHSLIYERERAGGGAEGEGQVDSVLSIEPYVRPDPTPETMTRVKIKSWTN